MPKLWNETIEAHRREVREAILEATATLVAEQGLLAVTMSRIAGDTGIGRATLYKYFPDVEAILQAWHERQVAGHLEQLERLAGEAGDAGKRLEAVLAAYARISHRRFSHAHPGQEVAALLHRSGHTGGAEHRVREMFRGLLAEAQQAGELRDDIAPDELASYCLHALAAAGSMPSEPAVERLVAVTLSGLRPPR